MIIWHCDSWAPGAAPSLAPGRHRSEIRNAWVFSGLPWWFSGNESACQCRRCGFIRSLGWEDPLEEEMGTHSSILAWKNLMDRGAWRATVHGVAKELDMTEQLSTFTYAHTNLVFIILWVSSYSINWKESAWHFLLYIIIQKMFTLHTVITVSVNATFFSPEFSTIWIFVLYFFEICFAALIFIWGIVFDP